MIETTLPGGVLTRRRYRVEEARITRVSNLLRFLYAFLTPYPHSRRIVGSMKIIKATLNTLISVTLLSISAGQANELEMAVDTALEAQRTDFLTMTPAASLTISNVALNLYPVYMLDVKGPAHTLMGTIAHTAADGTLHTVAYRIAKHRGVIKEILLQVDHGELKSMSPAMMKALGTFLEKSGGNQEERKRVAADLRKAADGSWLSFVELIVAHIGMRHC